MSLPPWGDREPDRCATLTIPEEDVPELVRENLKHAFHSNGLLGGPMPMLEVLLRRVMISQVTITPNYSDMRSDVTFEITWAATEMEQSS